MRKLVLGSFADGQSPLWLVNGYILLFQSHLQRLHTFTFKPLPPPAAISIIIRPVKHHLSF